MLKNVASQSVALFAFDTTTGTPKSGDAANMVFYITKDWGSVTAIASNSGVPTEMDATNAKGWYKIAVSQTETNADAILLSGKSSTSNIVVVGQRWDTDPANYTKAVIDSSGLIDANAVKVGPTGSGTAQTARDLGASVLLSTGTGTGQLDFTSGVVKANVTQFNGSAGTFASGRPEVDLNSSATTELTSVPASTATLKNQLQWLFLLARNKITQTATTQLVKANDGSTTVGTSTVSDDTTTATRGAFS